MTSFDSSDELRRPVGAGGDVSINPASGIDDPTASEAARAIMALFEARTGGKRLLTRRDFTPADLSPFLSEIMILDLVFDGGGKVSDAVVRLMGGSLSAFYGEATGKSVLDHPTQAGARAIITAQRSIDCGGTMVSRVVQSSLNKPHVDIRTLMVPIADEKGDITQMLVHFQVYNRQGDAVSPV